MKLLLNLIFLSFLFSGTYYAQAPANSKYLEFKTDGKTGLCDLSGKTIVAPVYKTIKDYNDNYFLAEQNNEDILSTIKGKIIYSFPHRIVNVKTTKAGGLMVFDSSKVYFFNKKMKFISSGSFNSKNTEVNDHERIITFVSKEKRGDTDLFNINIYDNSNFKLLSAHVLTNEYGFRKEKTRKGSVYFEMSSVDDNKTGENWTLFDISGIPILKSTLSKKERDGDWFEFKNERLYESDIDNTDEIVNAYYNGKRHEALIKTLFVIENKTEGANKTANIFSLEGSLIKSFAHAEIEANETSDKDRKNEIDYLTLSLNDNTGNVKEYFVNTRFEITGEQFLWFNPDSANADGNDMPEERDGIVTYAGKKRIHLFDTRSKKNILSFAPDTSSFYNTKELFPVSRVEDKSYFAYKEGNSYGIYYLKTGKKNKLFNFLPSSHDQITRVKFRYRQSNQTVSFEVTLKNEKTKERYDTTFTFFSRKNGSFIFLDAYRSEGLYPFSSFDPIEQTAVNFAIPGFYKLYNKRYTDSLIIINGDGKIILKEKNKFLYCVGSNYIALSDEKESSLFDFNFKTIKDKIPGTVCAVIKEGKEFIIYENQSYFISRGGKIQKLFTQNELMGWPLKHFNHIDSADYKMPAMIIHAQQNGSSILIYQSAEPGLIQLATYDLNSQKLEICPHQLYYDITADNDAVTKELFEKRFSLLGKKQSDGPPCTNTELNRKRLMDTLSVFYDEAEPISFLNPKYKNFHLFNTKESAPFATYFGTLDSIYYKFNSEVSAGNWDCGVLYFGDAQKDMFILDPLTHELSADMYSTVETGYDNNCDGKYFMATNLRTKRQELFRITEKGNIKLHEGYFSNYDAIESSADGFGRSKNYFIFYDNAHRILYHTDANMKLLYDTLKYKLKPDSDPTSLWEGGGNYLILQSKENINEHYLFNGITGSLIKIDNGTINSEDYGNMHLLFVGKNDTSNSLKTMIAVETGEVLPDYSEETEWFIFNKKIYYRKFSEDGRSYSIFNSNHKKIK